MTTRLKHSLFILFGIALLCTAQPAAADMRDNIANTIDNMTADLSCDTSEQCKSIGFGDKPCGGFQSYKIYSTKNIDEKSFTTMVTSYNELDKQNNIKNNLVSNCMMTLPPSVSCVQGQCTSAPGNANIY